MPIKLPSLPNSVLPDRAVLLGAIRAMLVPIARLATASGVKFQDVSDMLKLAMMEAGTSTLKQAGQRVNASTLSVSTGLHRKDLAEFLAQDQPKIDSEPPIEAKVFARWSTDAAFCDPSGRALALPRTSEGESNPSFEKLVRLVTTDVRPRAVLESMLRLGLVSVDQDQQVVIVAEQMVPKKSGEKMLALMRDNSRDHMNAAVANVLGADPAFLEQSIYASKMSAAASERVHQKVRRYWQTMTNQLVPQIQNSIDADSSSIKDGLEPAHRIRIGVYFYSEPEDTKDSSQ